MINIAICDDEKSIVELVKRYIDSVTKELGKIVCVTPYIDWKSLEYDLSERELFDIIFMDIEYGDINGIELVKSIKQTHPTTNIIFITGHHEYVFEVFEVRPFGFIRKPIEYQEFKNVLIRVLDESQNVSMFEYTNNRTVYKVSLKSVVWFNSDGRKIHIKTIDDEREFYGKLDDVENQVNAKRDSFMRVSQSYLINTEYISGVACDKVVIMLKNQKVELKVARGYKNYIMDKYMNDWEEM